MSVNDNSFQMSTFRFCLWADDKKINPTGDLEQPRTRQSMCSKLDGDAILLFECPIHYNYDYKRGIDRKIRGYLVG